MLLNLHSNSDTFVKADAQQLTAEQQQQAIDNITSDPAVVIDARVIHLNGTPEQLDLVTLELGEIAVELTAGTPNKTLRIGDGVTAGGIVAGGIVAGPGAVQLIGADDTINVAPIQVADSLEITNVAGNPRGAGAVDLQRKRVHAQQVAQAADSVILGGTSNAIDDFGQGSDVGGLVNYCGASTSFVRGGYNQLAKGNDSIVIGQQNKVSNAQYSQIFGQSHIGAYNNALVAGLGACFGRANSTGWMLTKTGPTSGTLVSVYGLTDPTVHFSVSQNLILFGYDPDNDPLSNPDKTTRYTIASINSSGDVTFMGSTPIPDSDFAYVVMTEDSPLPAMILLSNGYYGTNQVGSTRVTPVYTTNAVATLLCAIPFNQDCVHELDIRIQASRSGTGTMQVASYWRRVILAVAADGSGTIKATQTPAADYEDVAGWDIAITANNTTKTFDITVTGDTEGDAVVWSATVEFHSLNRI